MYSPVTGWWVPTARGLGAAVDVEGLAGDVTGQRTGQENGGPGHLVDVTGAAHRDGQSEALLGPGRATDRMPSVSVMSGARALTRMPCGANSSAAVLVKLITPAFAAA